MTSTGPRNRGRPADAKNRVTSLVEMARPAPKEGTIATRHPFQVSFGEEKKSRRSSHHETNN